MSSHGFFQTRTGLRVGSRYVAPATIDAESERLQSALLARSPKVSPARLLLIRIVRATLAWF